MTNSERMDGMKTFISLLNSLEIASAQWSMSLQALNICKYACMYVCLFVYISR